MASLRCDSSLLIFLLLGCGRDSPATGPAAAHASPRAPNDQNDQKVAFATNAYRKVAARVEELEKQVLRDPGNARLHYELGSALLMGGIQQRGLDELEKALSIDPSHSQAAVLICRTRLQMGDLDGAERSLKDALARRETADLRAIEAELALRRDPDARDAAQKSLARALELDPHNVEALYQRGVLAFRCGDAAVAEASLREVVRRNPSHLGAHFNLARLLREQGRDGEAAEVAAVHKRLAILETLGRLDDPTGVEAFTGVAQVLDNGGDLDGEIAELDRGIERYPDTGILRVKKALACISGNRPEEGRKTFETAVRQLPGDSMVANQFAWYLATHSSGDDDRRRAVKLAEKAVALSGRKDPNYLDTLAEARLVSGDKAASQAAIDEALKLSPNDAGLQRRKQDLQRRAAEHR